METIQNMALILWALRPVIMAALAVCIVAYVVTDALQEAEARVSREAEDL